MYIAITLGAGVELTYVIDLSLYTLNLKFSYYLTGEQ